jgi:hypothetical protein
MICPFDSKIHCMYLEDANDHGFVIHPTCPDCPHYNGGEEVDHPQYVGWKAYAIMFGIFAGAGIFSCALIYVLYGIIFGW